MKMNRNRIEFQMQIRISLKIMSFHTSLDHKTWTYYLLDYIVTNAWFESILCFVPHSCKLYAIHFNALL